MTTLPAMRRYSVLSGVRVIELGQVVAAPHCGLLLSAAGADVIKVERPPAGDDTRQNAAFYESGASAYFTQQNWGKRSVVLDLSGDRAKSVFARLLSQADVLIENLRPGAIGRLGFGWPQVSQLNPRLVMCSISGFGQTGPDSRRPGYGALAEARAGLYEMTGDPGGPPVSGQLPVADMLAAGRAFGMICAALVARQRTGRGDYLDVALLDCAAELQDWALERYLATDGRDRPTRRGSADDALVPWGQFATADGWVVLIVSADRFWPTMARLLAGLESRPEFDTTAGRRLGRQEIYAAVRQWAARVTSEQALALLAAADIPAERVATIADVAADRQLIAREMFATLPGAEGKAVLGTALRFASGATEPAAGAPALGAHTWQVLAQAGVTEQEAAALAEAGLVAGSAEPEAAMAGTGPDPAAADLPTTAEFRKTLSETDLILFAGLSGDLHPVHIDEESTAARDAGGRTIHAVFLIGLMSTAVARLMQARGAHSRVAGFRGLTFHRPAKPGDTVRACARIGVIRPDRIEVEVSASIAAGSLLADGIAEIEVS
jgi:crotonobetainyl-CoA:carnitine CoA-transferase CaiB-like acyl-CoA transferase/acyl dehydratase